MKSPRIRNVDYILSREAELFRRIGMLKIGYEGFQPTLITGGEVWYLGAFLHDTTEIYTICFESWFGQINLTYQRFLNRKMEA